MREDMRRRGEGKGERFKLRHRRGDEMNRNGRKEKLGERDKKRAKND